MAQRLPTPIACNMHLRVESRLLGKLNEREVLAAVQRAGSLSRAEVARISGLTPPTVSKAVLSLINAGLLEELDDPAPARGRPAKKVRLATRIAQVLGIVVDAGKCEVVSAGLDGTIANDRIRTFRTPATYAQLMDRLASEVRQLMQRPDAVTLGVGISLPGLVDSRAGRSILSPNVPITNGHLPAEELAKRLRVKCTLLQEQHALCLAERAYGQAKDADDFAMLDITTGVGLGVMSGGRLLTGHRGLAGEIGHLTVVNGGRKCGCGNRGCLETVANDSSLAWRVSKRLGRKLTIDQIIDQVQAGKLNIAEEATDTCRYVAICVAAVINLFNPASLFIHGRLFEADPSLFDQMLKMVRQRALTPSLADCRIVQAHGRKLQGAIAGVIQQLTSEIAPRLSEAGFSHR